MIPSYELSPMIEDKFFHYSDLSRSLLYRAATRLRLTEDQLDAAMEFCSFHGEGHPEGCGFGSSDFAIVCDEIERYVLS